MEGPGQAAWRLLAWAGAVLAMLVSFWNDWTIPLLGTDLRPKRGHVLMEAGTLVQWSLIGSLIGGWWWSTAPRWRRAGAAFLLAWSLAGLGGVLSREVFWLGWLAWLVPAVGRVAQTRGSRWGGLKAFWMEARPWNGGFCLVWFLVLLGCDAVILRDAPPGWLETADALMARLLTHVVIAAGMWLLLAWHDRWTPPVVRWTGWAVVLVVPLLVIINTALRVWWGKGMVEMFGELEVGGRFEIERAWAAGGVQLDAATILTGVGCVLVMVAVFGLCAWASRRAGWKISPLRLACIVGGAWLLLQADQVAGAAWKDRAWRWWERKAFHRRMTWVEPEPGMAGYEVVFANPRPVVTKPALKTRPDVFLFMVESLRADALQPQIAPFLCRWREEECQPLGEAWAASNVTHQSWFSLLSGRLPVFMDEARRERRLAPLPALLKAADYRVEVRMVNNFDYMDMVAGNFGDPLEVDVLEQVDGESPENFFKVPEREVRMLKRLKLSVGGRDAGGLFAITGMDSTHYNYKWGASFTPPFSDYEEDPIFPMRPTPEEARRIQRRFWNSVAWVDAQLAEFIGWLKAQGRYDDALIIVTGDHGEEFKEQGSWFHGTMLNEPQTRVPILIKWPQSLGVGRGPAVPLASHLDILPTVLDALGCAPESRDGLPGISLLHPPAGERTLVMSTHFCGRNGEALILRRGAAEAAFGWRDFWTPHVPDALWMERLEGVELKDWQEAFSDLLPRLFKEVR